MNTHCTRRDQMRATDSKASARGNRLKHPSSGVKPYHILMAFCLLSWANGHLSTAEAAKLPSWSAKEYARCLPQIAGATQVQKGCANASSMYKGNDDCLCKITICQDSWGIFDQHSDLTYVSVVSFAPRFKALQLYMIPSSGGNENYEIVSTTDELSKRTVVVQGAIADNPTLHQNYPNPFSSATEVRISLPERTNVNLTIHDYLGRRVATIVESEVGAGSHSIRFNGKNLPSGTYILRMTTSNGTVSRIVTILR